MNNITHHGGELHFMGLHIGNLDTPISRVFNTADQIRNYRSNYEKVVIEPTRNLLHHVSGHVFQVCDDGKSN
jgi:hypothetical protein